MLHPFVLFIAIMGFCLYMAANQESTNTNTKHRTFIPVKVGRVTTFAGF